MQKSVAIVLIIAAFLAGALADRVLRWAMTADAVAASNVPMPPGPGTAQDPTNWDMKGCMASAQRRGMRADEASHACQAVMN